MSWLAWAALATAVAAGIRGIWSPCGLSMVSAINPMSERARGHRYWATCAWFITGSLAGGLLLGGAAAGGAYVVSLLGGSLAGIAAVGAAAVGAAAAIVALAADLRVGGFALPTHPRQVNERWLDTFRRWVYAGGFGLQIGTGFATYIMTAATYLMVALAVLTGSAQVALLTGAAFGLVRGLAVTLTAASHHPAALLLLHRRLAAAAPWSLALAMATEAAVAATLGWYAGSVPGAGIAVGAVGLLVGSSVAFRRANTSARTIRRFTRGIPTDERMALGRH